MQKIFLVFLLLVSSLHGQESSSLEEAREFNKKMQECRLLLQEKFQSIELSEPQMHTALLQEIASIRASMQKLEEEWKKSALKEGKAADEPYAFWDIGETTLAQLIMEYGVSEYLYIIPPELSGMKLTLFSSIPLPRESWSEMIEMILVHNGVGVKTLSANVKQLYILKIDASAIEGIVSKEEDLIRFSPHARLFYVLNPTPDMTKSVQTFLERFSDPKLTTIHAIGTKIGLVASRDSIEKLLGLYHAVWEKVDGKMVRLIPLSKVQPSEAEKVLRAVFSDLASKNKPTFYPSMADELITLVLPQGLVLVGEKQTVQRAENLLNDLENQLEDPGEKVIYWYACKHANPEDIAMVLEKIYDSLTGSQLEKKGETLPNIPTPELSDKPPISPIQPSVMEKRSSPSFGNFVVDPKTTSILMVIRREELSKIKAILKKLDTPTRMVQLDVLLVEKKTHDRKQVGIDLLRFGTAATHADAMSMAFDTEEKSLRKGVLSFLFHRKGEQGGPPLDLTYSFLLAQEDVRINANPSVLAVNQTPVTFSVTEEISINNGAVQLSGQNGAVEHAYTRAQYGITVVLTPTVHWDEENEDETGFVSLTTNLEFDTTKMALNDRPPVTRRHIENQVYVADGETIILGGLRSKIEEDSREKIPFLGDIPGVGKLFGSTKTTEHNTEMFIFITPRIIHNGVDDLRRLRQSEYYKRAGDVPEFLEYLDAAKKREKSKLFQHSMQMLFDMY